MKSPVQFLLAAALATAAFSAFAEPRIPLPADPDRADRVAEAQQVRQTLLAARATSGAPKAGAAINSATPSLPTPNPYNAYPPSCMAYPLPDQVSGPTFSTVANLAAYDRINDEFVLEGVTITIWRVACSSDTFFNSATLMRIQRQGIYEGDDEIYPLFPVIDIKQSSANYDQIPRFAYEPNTVVSDVLPETPIVDSTTYVLENYIGLNADYFDFNTPFSVRFDNLFATDNLFFINNIPLYDPNPTTYPAAFQDLPISGYLATNWFDPDASGEGIVLQIYQRPGELNTFVAAFAWQAYDPGGTPFWLFGQADFTRGARSVTAGMFYLTGGGFAGDAGDAGAPIPWGSATISFPSCNDMNLSYASIGGLPASVPQGSGSRLWTRVATVNGLPCE